MNKPVSYKLAKLLKEKGFDKPLLNCYFGDVFYPNYSVVNQYDERYMEDEGYFRLIPYNENDKGLDLETINFNDWGSNYYSAPTIADVAMWLYEKHGIWISVFNDDVNFFWMGIVLNTKERLRDGNAREFNSPTEAYEAAIEYTLNNLI